MFMNEYSKQDSSTYFTFVGDLQEVVEYVNSNNKNIENIYITNSIKDPYIYFLFYGKYNTNDFVKTVQYENEKSDCQTVISFGKYNFNKIKQINTTQNAMYIIKESELANLKINSTENMHIKQINDYLIITK